MVKKPEILLRKLIVKHAKKLISIVIISIISVAFISGINAFSDNLNDSINNMYSSNNTSDAISISDQITEENLEKLDNLNYIDKIIPFFFFEIDINNYLSRIIAYNFDDDTYPKVSILEGRKIENPNEVLMNIKYVTDEYYLNKVVNFLDDTYTIVGVVQDPYYFDNGIDIAFSTNSSIEQIFYINTNFIDIPIYSGVFLYFKNLEKLNKFSNKYSILLDENITKLEKDIDFDFNIISIIDTQSFKLIKSNSEKIEKIAIIFPVLFLIVSLLVITSTMTRIIEEERFSIGTLKSLGFSNFKIRENFLLLATFSSIIGCLIGILIGFRLLPILIYNAFKSTFYLPKFVNGFYLTIGLVSSVLIIIISILSTFISMLGLLKNSPYSLLLKKPPLPGKKIFLEHIKFIWKKLSFKYKSTFRNIFRNKKHFLMIVMGLTLSTSLIFVALSLNNSVDKISTGNNDIFLYSHNLKIENNVDGFSFLGENSEFLAYNLTYSRITFKKEKMDISVMTFNIDDKANINKYINLVNRVNKNKLVLNNTNEVIITESLAKTLHIKENDTILVEKVDYIVKAITLNYIGSYIYRIDNSVQTNNIFLKTNDEIYINNLKNSSEILKIEKNDSTIYQNLQKQISYIIILIICLAIMFGIVIMHNLTITNISERHTEIATLKVLGYKEIEVDGYIFREMLIYVMISTILGIFFGILLNFVITNLMDSYNLFFGREIYYYTYLITVFANLIFLLLIYLLTKPSLRKIKMSHSLKAIE
ncbi:MAG: ABC transporter permease [Acholeplasmatales bacterium]|jgi:putative ABC transport system permease protein|nr:ABC transporter permease [Acholeplasmatales bacterium]